MTLQALDYAIELLGKPKQATLFFITALLYNVHLTFLLLPIQQKYQNVRLSLD